MKRRAVYMKNEKSWITPTFARCEADGWEIEVKKNNVPEQISDDPSIGDEPEWYWEVSRAIPGGKQSVATWEYPEWVVKLGEAMIAALVAAPEYKDIFRPAVLEFEAAA